MDFLVYYDEETFVGFAYLVTHKNLTFVLFLSTSSEVRSKGYGTMILSMIRKRYIGNRIILNIEEVKETADNYEQRHKRKVFYVRNGFRNATFYISEYGYTYEVLVYGDHVSFDEYKTLFRVFTGKLLSLFYSPKLFKKHES
ncbi:GNAT family N-acetyltransferase [Paenibacillus sp. Z6-24]